MKYSHLALAACITAPLSVSTLPGLYFTAPVLKAIAVPDFKTTPTSQLDAQASQTREEGPSKGRNGSYEQRQRNSPTFHPYRKLQTMPGSPRASRDRTVAQPPRAERSNSHRRTNKAPQPRQLHLNQRYDSPFENSRWTIRDASEYDDLSSPPPYISHRQQAQANDDEWFSQWVHITSEHSGGESETASNRNAR